MDPLDINDSELLNFLYKNIGLKWELHLVHSSNLTSLANNPLLYQFFRENKIIYHITNSNNIPQIVINSNEFYFTATGANRVGSLLKHLRNSIMHGNYKVKIVDHDYDIYFRDEYRKNCTMIGRVLFSRLQELMRII